MTASFDPMRILEILSEEGVSYVVIGGIAAGWYGSNRATFDLDIVPEPGLENARRLARALERLEARFRGIGAEVHDIGLDAETLAQGANFTLTSPSGDLDVMPITEGGRSWEALRSRSVTAELGGDLPIRVVGIDDLIAMKRAVGRRQDIEDIVQLTAGAQLARNARSRVVLTGAVRTDASDDKALEAADLATLSYEGNVKFVVERKRPGDRRLRVEAELDGFARSHAEVWVSVTRRKIEEAGVIDGAISAEIESPG